MTYIVENVNEEGEVYGSSTPCPTKEVAAKEVIRALSQLEEFPMDTVVVRFQR